MPRYTKEAEDTSIIYTWHRRASIFMSVFNGSMLITAFLGSACEERGVILSNETSYKQNAEVPRPSFRLSRSMLKFKLRSIGVRSNIYMSTQ